MSSQVFRSWQRSTRKENRQDHTRVSWSNKQLCFASQSWSMAFAPAYWWTWFSISRQFWEPQKHPPCLGCLGPASLLTKQWRLFRHSHPEESFPSLCPRGIVYPIFWYALTTLHYWFIHLCSVLDWEPPENGGLGLCQAQCVVNIRHTKLMYLNNLSVWREKTCWY